MIVKLKKKIEFPSEYDIACFCSKASTLNDSQLKNLIRNDFVPDERYCFPKTNGRSFQLIWFKQFSWLSYSPSEDGAYCLSCVLFGFKYFLKSSRCKNLFSEPVKHWPDAVSAFKRHYHEKKGKNNEHHLAVPSLPYNTLTIFSAVLNTMNGSIQSIDILNNKIYEKEVALYRDKLHSIVDSIIFLGRLNIAFRGQRDDSQHHPTVGKYSLVNGVGNFVELLNYRIRGGDKVLEHHLNICAKNASYISHSSKNEIINCCGKYIQIILISDIKENQFFLITANEASDCSNQEQMSLIIRFIDSSFDVREEIMGLLHCKYDYSLDISNCRGQGYDGAGSVAGHNKGLAKRIKNHNDKAVYTHRFSHRLNLSVANSCKLQEVRNMMEQKQLSPNIVLLQQRKKLIDVCRTRWVERITGLDEFESLIVPIVYCLEGMTVLDYTIPVTQMLQDKTFDICDGLSSISALKSCMLTLSNLIDDYHIKWYDTILCLASKVDVAEVKPRVSKCQIYGNNVPSCSTSDYFKKSLTISLFDHLLFKVNNRFSDDALVAYDGLVNIPDKMMSYVSKKIEN
ncbi:52 kDa repressor of the inhibitor of the protein kinase-like [Hydra vulgaris]|uniref:52 kDa repressor of the inhibitor of the protein kinase-like n=1 Tax=Hydra vulgaris TaxID=6087 RepID=A0ABM4DF66_HYDVU